MTTTTETTEAPVVDAAVLFAHELFDSLTLLANVCLTRPDAAALLAPTLKNLINPVADDDALYLLADAVRTSGGTVAGAKGANGTAFTGIELKFGKRVLIWAMADVPPEPARVAVEVAPGPLADGPEAVPEPVAEEPVTDVVEAPAVDLDATQAYEVNAS